MKPNTLNQNLPSPLFPGPDKELVRCPEPERQKSGCAAGLFLLSGYTTPSRGFGCCTTPGHLRAEGEAEPVFPYRSLCVGKVSPSSFWGSFGGFFAICSSSSSLPPDEEQNGRTLLQPKDGFQPPQVLSGLGKLRHSGCSPAQGNMSVPHTHPMGHPLPKPPREKRGEPPWGGFSPQKHQRGGWTVFREGENHPGNGAGMRLPPQRITRGDLWPRFLVGKRGILLFPPATLRFPASQGLTLPSTETAPAIIKLLIFLFSPPKRVSHLFRDTRSLPNKPLVLPVEQCQLPIPRASGLIHRPRLHKGPPCSPGNIFGSLFGSRLCGYWLWGLNC
ncbi:factor in the germline alpha isoform 2-T2 [Morphnus guianensis]